MRKTTVRSDAFDAIAQEYDSQFTDSMIGRAQRRSVWAEMDRHFRSGQRVLEINCGTGVDALHLAARGLWVTACDASPEMVRVAHRRREASPWRAHVDLHVLSIEQISQLDGEGPFDGVLSNFAGLNCVQDLPNVAEALARLVRPGGRAVLGVFGAICLWEVVWFILRGEGRKAIRRFKRSGNLANLGPDHDVWVRYPSVASLRRDFAPHFHLLGWKGVGVAVPPTYVEPWAAHFPHWLEFAAALDIVLGKCPGARALADHIVLVFERVQP